MRNLLFIFIICTILINFVYAEVNPCGNNRDFLGYFQQYSNITLTQKCDSCTYVNISSYTYPNSTMVVLNQVMIKNGIEYTYLLENASEKGCQTYTVYGDKDGELETESFDLIINPTGIYSTETKTESISRAIYFTLILGILFFVGFLFMKSKVPVKWTMFIFALFFFLITLNLLFVGLQDEVVNPRIESFFDSFTAISFYVYWFLAGVLSIIWFLTFIQTWLLKKNQSSFNKYGGNY